MDLDRDGRVTINEMWNGLGRIERDEGLDFTAEEKLALIFYPVNNDKLTLRILDFSELITRLKPRKNDERQ